MGSKKPVPEDSAKRSSMLDSSPDAQDLNRRTAFGREMPLLDVGRRTFIQKHSSNALESGNMRRRTADGASGLRWPVRHKMSVTRGLEIHGATYVEPARASSRG